MLVSVSLARLMVTSVSSSLVIMSHPLKRISYATCDPASCLFSFMSRHHNSQYNIQQCHTFRSERKLCRYKSLLDIYFLVLRDIFPNVCSSVESEQSLRFLLSETLPKLLNQSDTKWHLHTQRTQHYFQLANNIIYFTDKSRLKPKNSYLSVFFSTVSRSRACGL